MHIFRGENEKVLGQEAEVRSQKQQKTIECKELDTVTLRQTEKQFCHNDPEHLGRESAGSVQKRKISSRITPKKP